MAPIAALGITEPFWQGVVAGIVILAALELLFVGCYVMLAPFFAKQDGRHSPPVLRPGAQQVYERIKETSAPLHAPEPLRAVQTLSAPEVVLPFGKPERRVYRSVDYVEPLKCSVSFRCDGRRLRVGELFWSIPAAVEVEITTPFLVVCSDCAVTPEETTDGA